ncbi:MAG: hypothetical protein IKK48_05150, partial [Firmicutes bacterium]|nr:hypothetical protein [Bacillota bacterium]
DEVIVIEGRIGADYRARCGRCGKPLEAVLHIDVTEEYARNEDETHPDRYLFQGDVIYMDEEVVVVVNTPPCEVIEIALTPGHEKYAAKVCYEIGNRHAPLFWGEDGKFITIYDEPMMVMLQKIHGVVATKKTAKLDFDQRISAAIHNHHH